MVNLLHRILCIILNDYCEDCIRHFRKRLVLMRRQVLKLYAHHNYNFVEHTHI